MARRGQIGGAAVDGPLAFDNAISAAAAKEKGTVSEVAGDTDIVLVPNLVAGNILAKNLELLAGAVAAGVVMVVDATAPQAGLYDAAVCFFLLHELPDDRKRRVVDALLDRVGPEDKVVFVDYHRPRRLHPLRFPMSLILRWLEPFAKPLWHREISSFATRPHDVTWRKTAHFGGLYQTVVASRPPPGEKPPEDHMSTDRDSIAAVAQPDAPVTVVGAGPAGLACAIVLARAGRKVIVREWHASVGSRFHGDFQGLENWSGRLDILDELRAAGIEIDFDCHPIHDGTAFDAWGEAYPIRADRPLYYLVHRGSRGRSLDRGLLAQAIASGAEVRFGDRARAAEGITILATGPRTADAIAAGYVFDSSMPDGSWIVFNDALAPRGYAYLLVHSGRGTVASCMFTGFKRQAEHVERTVAFFRERAGLEMRDPRPFGGFANFRLQRTAVQGGHPVIGEQAGFQDALAGFGMRYALRSGILAARSLIEAADYTRLWRRELRPLLRTGVANRFIFNTIGERGWRWVLRGLSRSDSREKLRRLYQPSLLSRLVYPLAAWRYRAPLSDPSCDHAACACIWCTHGAQEVAECTIRSTSNRNSDTWKFSI